MAKRKKIEKVETGANMDGSNMGGTKPNIKLVRQRHPNAPEYPPTHGGLLGPKRIDWGKKGNTPTGKGGSGSKNAVGNFGAAIEKEDGGGDGALAGGATVFTSTNAGIFTPTYGGNGKHSRVKSKKKKTGIERLGVFLTDGSPEKKMAKTNVLKEWVQKQEEEKLPQVVERKGHPDKMAAVQQKDTEQHLTSLEDDSNGNISPPRRAGVKLSKQPQAFGNPQDDELKRGSKKDNSKWSESVELELKKFIEELTNNNSQQSILDEINIRKSGTAESLLRRI